MVMHGGEIEVNYESSNTRLNLASGEIYINNGDIIGFNRDRQTGINFIGIYGLSENFEKTSSDIEYVVGFGKEGIALFGSNGTIKYKNTEIDDMDFKKIAITDTGFILTDNDESRLIQYDFNLNITTRDAKDRTLPDLYLEHLYSTGLSLDNLRVLVGGVDEKLTVDEILDDEEQKEKAEKYIKEFLRADLISSSTHKTNCKKNIDPDNSDKIDGGIYIWRTNSNMYEWNENNIDSEFALNNAENPEIQRMIFVPYNIFHETFENDMGSGATELDFVNAKGWLKDYTINPNGEIEVFVFNLHYVGNENVPLADLFGRSVETHAKIATIDYKEYIKEYTMPYEFLMATAYTCENPEYAYHMAFMARETMIDLVICDEYNVEYSNSEMTGYKWHTNRVETKYTRTKDTSGNIISDVATGTTQKEDESLPETTLEARTEFSLTGNVNAFVVRADAWEKFYKTTLYRKGITPTISEDNVTGVNEIIDGPTPYSDPPTDEYRAPNDTNGTLFQYEIISGDEYTIMTSSSTVSKSYRVEYDTKKVEANGDDEGYKYKVFYGLLRVEEESEAEDKCDCEDDVIRHLRDIEPAEQGYNTVYKLQTIGIDDPPINIMANERDVLYRQIEAFGNAFNKVEVETGEQEHNSDDTDETEENTTNDANNNGTNYDWLYAYLDSAFADFHLGEFQDLEVLPDGFGELFGTWDDDTGSGGGEGPGNLGEIPPPGERVDESNFVHYCQWDPRWGNDYYRTIDGGAGTLAHNGCMLTSMAMVIRNLYGIDRNPHSVYMDYRNSNYAASHSQNYPMYDEILSIYCPGKTAKKYPANQSGFNSALADVANGDMAIFSCYYGAIGDEGFRHAVLVSAYDDQGLHLHDPAQMDSSTNIIHVSSLPTANELYQRLCKNSYDTIYVFSP